MKHKKRGPANPLQDSPKEWCYANGKKKKKYQTKLDAEIFAPHRDLEQYICEYCGYWHNGNSDKKT